MMTKYLIALNLFTLCLCISDKLLAKTELPRVPEKVFFFLSFIGGSAGMLVGMYLIRHKTRKTYFTIGIPLLLLWNIAAIIFIYTKTGLR